MQCWAPDDVHKRRAARLRRERRSAILWSVVVVMVLFAIACLVVSGCSSHALAHDSWISRGGLRNGAGEWCCGEGDCFVVPGKNISIGSRGYKLQWQAIVSGKDAGSEENVPYAEAQPSPDRQYLRCKRPDRSRR